MGIKVSKYLWMGSNLLFGCFSLLFLSLDLGIIQYGGVGPSLNSKRWRHRVDRCLADLIKLHMPELGRVLARGIDHLVGEQ